MTAEFRPYEPRAERAIRQLHQQIANLEAELEDAEGRIALLGEVLDRAIDVFRHHDCPQSHLAPECRLCEILVDADALLAEEADRE